MRLTEKAINTINTNQTRLKLALKLNITDTWVRKLISSNKPNGPLTTAAALEVIKEESGLPDNEILEGCHHETVTA